MLVKMQSNKDSHSLLMRMQNDSLADFYKAKHSLTMWFSNHAARYYAIELKTYANIKTCIQMFIADVFIIIKNWKQSRYPSIWLDKQILYNGIVVSDKKK